MARRGKGGTATAEPEAPAAPDTEVSESTEASEAEVAAAAEASEPNTDLTEFTSAVSSAVAERDSTTGVLAEEVTTPVVRAYQSLDGAKPKGAARKLLNEAMTEAMNEGDVVRARAYMELYEKVTSAKGKRAGSATERKPKEPANPTEAFVERVATLLLANELVENEAPENLDEDWREKVSASLEEARSQAAQFRDWFTAEVGEDEDRPEEPEVSLVAKAATKLALGKAAKPGKTVKRAGSGEGYSGPRRDIAKHILEAFADQPDGKFLKIAEIGKYTSSEYGDDHPSPGAISARLFPPSGKCTIEGIVPDMEDGRKGARKVA